MFSAFKYITGGYGEIEANVFSEIHNEMTKGKVKKLQHKTLQVDLRKKFFTIRIVEC